MAAYALLRVSRDVWTASLMVADYTWTLWGVEGEERRQKLEECHWRNADRLKRCFNANGGNATLTHSIHFDLTSSLHHTIAASVHNRH